MLRKRIFDWFREFFAMELAEIERTRRFNELVERDDSFQKSRFIELERYLNQPVVCFSNEIENPVVGIVTGIDFITQSKSPVLVVHDYIADKDLLILGKTFSYSSEFLKDVSETPKRLILQLLYGRYSSDGYCKKKATEPILSYEEIMERLKTNGFFDVLNNGLKEGVK